MGPKPGETFRSPRGGTDADIQIGMICVSTPAMNAATTAVSNNSFAKLAR